MSPIVIGSQREGEGGLLLALGLWSNWKTRGMVSSLHGLVGRDRGDRPKGLRPRRVEKRSSRGSGKKKREQAVGGLLAQEEKMR